MYSTLLPTQPAAFHIVNLLEADDITAMGIAIQDTVDRVAKALHGHERGEAGRYVIRDVLLVDLRGGVLGRHSVHPQVQHPVSPSRRRCGMGDQHQ